MKTIDEADLTCTNNVLSNYGKGNEFYYFKRILHVLDEISAIISNTMGPYGSHAMYYVENNATAFTKDGHTILNSIKFFDEFDKMIHQLICEISRKMLFVVGDGTSTGVVFTCQLISQLIKSVMNVEKRTFTNYQLSKSIKLFGDALISAILDDKNGFIIPKDKLTRDDILSVVSIALDANKDLAEVVTDAVETVGSVGTVRVLESYHGDNTFTEIVPGYEFSFGMISDVFAKSNLSENHGKTNTVEYKKPTILILNFIIDESKGEDVVLFINDISKKINGAPLIIIANGYAVSIANKIIEFKMKNIDLPLVLIEASNTGDGVEKLQDLISYLDCKTYANSYASIRGEKIYLVNSDFIDSITVGCGSTVINKSKLGLEKTENSVNTRVKYLESQLAITSDFTDANKLKSRIFKIKNGKQVIIHVGGVTSTERRAKMYAIDDAYKAGMSAKEHGAISATFLSLNRVSKNILTSNDTICDDVDVRDAFESAAKYVNQSLIGDLYLDDSDLYFDLEKNHYTTERKLTSAKNDITVIESAVSLACVLINSNAALTHSIFTKHLR